jgi:DNA-3-methyladenine glycosylase
MKSKIPEKLSQEFFVRPTLEVARDLVGKIIVHRSSEGTTRGRIVETEAYIGKADKACHARFGRTKRNEPMFLKGGRTYIYLCYGLFDLLNIVTEEEGTPAAVLIRKIEPLSGLDPRLKSYGPGNLTKYLKLDRSHNNFEVFNNDKFFIIDDGLSSFEVETAERVGIEYAGDDARKKWRFVLTIR